MYQQSKDFSRSVKKLYQQSRDLTPITSPSPIMVQPLSTPLKIKATSLQDRQPDRNPTAPTEQVGRMSPVPPQCKGCKALICTHWCNPKDQGEYQEPEDDNKLDHPRTSMVKEAFNEAFKQEITSRVEEACKQAIKKDAKYISWRTSSEERWERRRCGKKDRPEDNIPYDDDEEECYKR